MSSKIFLINLARSKDRLACCRAEFNKAGLSFERVEAIDGVVLTQAQVDEYYRWQDSDYYKELSKGELACYLSHRKVWQKIIDEQLDFAVIFEDDIGVSSQTPDAIHAISGIKEEWDYIKLAEFPVKRDVAHEYKLKLNDIEFDLVTYQKVPNRTCAQVVSRSGAIKLLEHSKKISRPIDIDLQYWWEKDLKLFGLKPYPIRVNIGQKSTIDQSDPRKKSRRSAVRQVTSKFAFLKRNQKALKARLKALNGS
jgi:glycosyl transferase family 25